MADAILGAGDNARKTQSTTNPHLPERWRDLPGLVQNPLIDADVQVRILERVDETGSATLGELMALLIAHPHPAQAVLCLVHLEILDVEPGLIDASSILYRRIDRSRVSDKDPDSHGGVHQLEPGKGKLHRLNFPRPTPEIFFAAWSDRAAFRKEPMLRQPGIYLALYCGTAYSGWSAYLVNRLTASNHLLQFGMPDMVIAAVDRSKILTEAQIRVSERLLAQRIDKDDVLTLANRTLPAGDHVDLAAFAQADRFVREFVHAVGRAGLAFTGKAAPQQDPMVQADRDEKPSDHVSRFSLSACGVHATARTQNKKWVVQAGSQVRSDVMISAGTTAVQQRQELLSNHGLVSNGNHLLLTRDVVFDSAAGAARFVAGTGYSARIWRPLPQQAGGSGLLH